jgi:hypothetical protein
MSTMPNTKAITSPADVLEFPQADELRLRGGGDDDDDGNRIDDDDDGDDSPPGSPFVDY